MTDTIQPSPQRAREGERILPASRQMVGDEGEIAAPYEIVLKSLSKMLKNGKIEPDEWRAGRRFHADYQESLGSDVQAMDLVSDRIDGGMNGHMRIPQASAAQVNLDAAYAALHGTAQASLKTTAAAMVLGQGWPVVRFAKLAGIREATARRVTYQMLKVLADHYRRVDAGR